MAAQNEDAQGASAGSRPVLPRQDPSWPQDGHPVTELMAPTQGAASPFGETEFPLPADELGYHHPVTEINR